jgi:cytoskeletal protein CcmA (bactofilin family)
MFSKEKAKVEKVSTVVGEGTSINGELSFNHGVHIDGTVNGDVVASEVAKSVVIVSEHGKINGQLFAETILFNGELIGDAHVTGIAQLGASAKITGNVFYHKLEMAMGAEVVGSLRKLTDAEVSAMVSKLDGDRSVSSDYEVHDNE